jgi:hypothetical protein
MYAERFKTNPIITPEISPEIGDNINGASLIRAPEWISNPLGKYYLYFAHHGGKYIRMAYADRLEGPWKIYAPGVLHLENSYFNNHIASPDVHVLNQFKEIRMYYHGCCLESPPGQVTRLAVSSDGLDFTAKPEVIGSYYWRVFYWNNYWYTLEMPGVFRRSSDGISNFEKGPQLFFNDMRHCAVQLNNNELDVFYSNREDCPEHILRATVFLTNDWLKWRRTKEQSILTPEHTYEGTDCPLEKSKGGAATKRMRQLRDPCIFQEANNTYLLYSVAGESGIAISRLV